MRRQSISGLIPTGTRNSGGTVWTDKTDSVEYLLVRDQMLWFGTLVMPNSLINPNQLRANGITVNDDPYDMIHLRI
jgi:hypothetical protein